ncbi:hypothetical protein [Clostridium sp.]|uniref:hypothetical protein n=1 Tax=Clostridium sp. TaxID=1506 RepID=UPI00290CDA1C|nr:hypothetical protein [Clostridium sp.]MDU7363376.1 hypothetical protein [Clostridium sp.]
MGTKFYNEIHKSKEERTIEDTYLKTIGKHFAPSEIYFPYKCDGYLESNIMYDENIKVLRLLMEFKYGKNFNNSNDRAEVLVQILYYLKKFQLGLYSKFSELPNIILAGDKTTCFIVHVNEIEKYLSYDIDWSIAPSKAHIANNDLVKDIIDNSCKINTIIFDIKSNFKFDEVVIDIKRLLLNYNSKIKITENNITEIYDYFIQKIIKSPEQYTAQDLVYYFMNVITDNEDTFIHGKKSNVLFVRNNKKIIIDSWSYNYFISNYRTKYKPSEEDKLISIKDRLIEDTESRYNGEFFTPTIWCNEAHKEIEKEVGKDWRREYIVWDCAWGTGNLTRDFDFSKLICSTLREEDLSIGERYNRNSIKFQFDFLNDEVDEDSIKLPKDIEDTIKRDKNIIFFINLPFGEASNGKVKYRKNKNRIAETKIKQWMIKDGLKNCSQQLYAQFLYRLLKIKQKYKLDNMYICIFTPTLYLTGPRFDKFRDIFLKDFQFKSGFIFNASNFSDVSSQWEVAFSIWKVGEEVNKNEFKYSVREIGLNGEINKINTKTVYNVPELLRANNWIKPKSNKEKVDTILLKSGINIDYIIKQKNKDTLAFFMNDSNNVYANTKGVYILSCPVKRHIKTTEINKYNFEDCCSLFAARRLIKSSWINQKEEYMIPNKENQYYNEWIGESLILTLFDNASMQTSLRKINVNSKTFNIENELFFMGNDEIKNLADENRNFEVYEDCKIFNNERYVYTKLKNTNLSKEAQIVLDQAKKLIILSFKHRKEFNLKYPEYNINTWDAGWYQIKELLNIYMKDELNEFNKKLEVLKEKMVPKVYKLGFLK